MSDETMLAKCYQHLYQCMIEKDTNGLAGILDDTFVLIHMTGMRQTKAEFLRAVENGTLNYFSARHEDIQVAYRGNSGELIGKSLVEAAVFGGRKATWRLQLSIRLRKNIGSWVILEAIASTY